MRLLFEVGEFGPDDTKSTAYALVVFLARRLCRIVGANVDAGVLLAARHDYAGENRCAHGLDEHAAGDIAAALDQFGPRRVGAGPLFGLVVQMTTQILLLKPKVGGRLDGGRVLDTLMRAGLAAAAMLPAAAWAAGAVGARVDVTTLTGRLAETGAGIAAGVIVYGAVAALLRMEELRMVMSMLGRVAAATGVASVELSCCRADAAAQSLGSTA